VCVGFLGGVGCQQALQERKKLILMLSQTGIDAV
jgi:hypothetical protein